MYTTDTHKVLSKTKLNIFYFVRAVSMLHVCNFLILAHVFQALLLQGNIVVKLIYTEIPGKCGRVTQIQGPEKCNA